MRSLLRARAIAELGVFGSVEGTEALCLVPLREAEGTEASCVRLSRLFFGPSKGPNDGGVCSGFGGHVVLALRRTALTYSERKGEA